MDAIQYWQTVGQQEEWDAAEAMRWYEQQRDLMNNLNSENEHEHSDIDFGRIRFWQVHQHA